MNRFALLGLAAVLVPACAADRQAASPSPSPSSASPSGSASTAPAATPATTPPTTPPPAVGAFTPRSASFMSPTQGWVLGVGAKAGEATVVATRDGGTTWSLAGTIPVRVGADIDGTPHVSSIRFLSDTVGWAYGSKAYVTRDGGTTWREAAMPGGRTLVSIAASGTETYALLGTKPSEHLVQDGAVWKGTVAGDTFTRADSAGAVLPFEDVVVRGRTVLFEVGRDYPGTAYRVSNDAGRTWTTREPCLRGEDLRDVTASTEKDLVFVCDGPSHRSLRVSADGGRTTALRLREAVASSGGNVAAASPTTVTRTLDSPSDVRNATLQWSGDGGRTFRTVGPAPAPGGATSWAEARYVDTTFGTIVRRVATPAGVEGQVYVTSDAGATWTALTIA